MVGKPHEIIRQAVACFVTLEERQSGRHELGEDLRKWAAHGIGSFAKPETSASPTRYRRRAAGRSCAAAARIVTSNTVAGDVTTLEDLSVVTRLSAQHDEDRPLVSANDELAPGKMNARPAKAKMLVVGAGVTGGDVILGMNMAPLTGEPPIVILVA